KKCPGRVHVEKGEVTKESKREHNHRPDRSKIEAKQAIENMKKIAKETELSSQVVLSTMSKEVTESVASKLPGISSMKKTIQRIRQKEIMAPANPRTLDELVIPAEYKTTIYGKPFLLYDSKNEKSGKPRILIYSTEENLNLMTNCNNWYADALWRHIQDSGLAIKYREESNFALNIKKLNALSFVPPHLVINAYEAILETEFYIENETLLSDFLDYFESTWIGKLCRNKKRRNPRFPIELWNCYNLVKYDIPKTNNSVEGWHNSFNSTLNALHPSIWKFIEALKKEEKLNRLKMHQFLAGTEPRQKLKKYKDTASRIKAICNDFENRSINDFLKGIAQNLS
ncbi:MULE domain-containing protein, partial [Aphis craccivora]